MSGQSQGAVGGGGDCGKLGEGPHMKGTVATQLKLIDAT